MARCSNVMGLWCPKMSLNDMFFLKGSRIRGSKGSSAILQKNIFIPWNPRHLDPY
jgi:hypothetical protein